MQHLKMRPVDGLVIAFNSAFVVLWLVGLHRSPDAPPLLAGHVLAVSLVWLVGRPETARAPIGRSLRALYPIVLVAAFWFEVGAVRVAFHSGAFDHVVLGAEGAVLGFHPHEAWMPAMPSLWLSEPMYLAYALYYPLVFLTPVVLCLSGHQDLDKLVFRLALVYFACYASYALFPVDGPLFTTARYAGHAGRGLLFRLVAEGTAGGDALGAAFPSSHVAGSVAVALFTWSSCRRRTAWVFSAVAAGVAFSAVYTQRHYAADVVAGALLAVLIHYLVAPRLE